MKQYRIIRILFFLCLCQAGFAQETIPLYQTIPNEKQSNIREKTAYDEAGNIKYVSNVRNPRLLVYSPVTPSGESLVFCPGGGYQRLNFENARYMAQRLTKVGITVFLLVYRLPSEELMNDPSIGALQDVQEALRLVRRQAARRGLSPDRVGLGGASAGGHLAAMAATHDTLAFEKGKGTAGLRPDFLLLTWPVISFRPEYIHRGSARSLFGKDPDEQQIAFFSADEWVRPGFLPTFIVHANDDQTVSSLNSIRFYSALKKVKAPAELHIYETGGHGFGIAPDVKDSWIEVLYSWLERIRTSNGY